MNKHLIFVYGSLRNGYWNHLKLQDAEFLGYATTKLPFTLWIGKDPSDFIPTCVPNDGNTPLQGEVYEVGARTKDVLDMLETGYKSDKFSVSLDNGQILETLIYHHDKASDCPYIHIPIQVESGDYTKAVTRRGKRL